MDLYETWHLVFFEKPCFSQAAYHNLESALFMLRSQGKCKEGLYSQYPIFVRNQTGILMSTKTQLKEIKLQRQIPSWQRDFQNHHK